RAIFAPDKIIMDLSINLQNPVKVFLADDHTLFTDALRIALEEQKHYPIEVVGVAASGAELLTALQDGLPDVLLLDLNMPVMSGLDILPDLRKAYPDLAIMVVTNYSDAKFVRECVLGHQVKAYLHKSSELTELLQAIGYVIKGQSYISKTIQLYPRNEESEPEEHSTFDESFNIRYGLTRRETEVLKLIAMAKSNTEIAEGLYISPQTVGVHRKNIMRKLNITSTAS